MTLPILISVPHAGTESPAEVTGRTILSAADIVRDGDEQASEIFGPLRDEVAAFVTADIARAFVDMNRAPDDFRKDGVVKTHTCWNVPIYREPLDVATTAALIEHYYEPYHRRLSELSRSVRLGVDCHTMAAKGPPVGPDPGRTRPAVCVGDAHGACDPAWSEELVRQLARATGHEVTLNKPFAGGYITRNHSREMPWIQLEISRGDFATPSEKSDAVRAALRAWCHVLFTRS